MKTPIPQAPPEAVTFIDGENKDKSPTVRLNDNQVGLAWLQEIKAAYEAEKKNDSYKFQPPQSQMMCEFLSFELLIRTLETKKEVIIWDICREVYKDHGTNGGFESMCSRLFG